jgi:integrase
MWRIFNESRSSLKVAFTRFSLADMRPTAVTDRKEEGDDRIIDATGHSDERMVNKVYDRRRQRKVRATR